eukprot:6603071-Prymnesium_polylepis.1
MSSSAVGTMLYMSPEKAQCCSYDGKDDVWALGLMVVGGVRGQLLEDIQPPLSAMLAMNRPKVDELIGEACAKSTALGSLVVGMLCEEPSRRLTAQEVTQALE